MTPYPFAQLRKSFRAFAETIVPESVEMDEAAWADAERLIGDALQGRPSRVAGQLRLFVRATDLLSFLRFLRPFAALTPDARTRVLRSLESSPLLVVRRGFWGLRTLVYLGYYGRESVWGQLGYGASPEGWSEPKRSGHPG